MSSNSSKLLVSKRLRRTLGKVERSEMLGSIGNSKAVQLVNILYLCYLQACSSACISTHLAKGGGRFAEFVLGKSVYAVNFKERFPI